MTRVSSNPFTIQVQGASAQTGLSFPSNGDNPSNAFVAFQFLNPHQDSLPIWGPSGRGLTFIWKVRYRQQTGYYVAWWWSNNGQFLWDGGSSNTYLGAHPYPNGGAGGTSHNWELATDVGSDFTTTRAGTPKAVVKDVWFTQGLRVTRNGNGTKTCIFYTALPSVANGDVIEHTNPSGYGERNPPSPALTFGDSPWYFEYQHERLSGIVRGIKIFNKVLSEADMLAEAASDNLVTSEGQANIWWKKINPTPDNLVCEAGTGRNPIWAQSTRATLWTG